MSAIAEAPSRNGSGPKRDTAVYRKAVKARMKKYEVGPDGSAHLTTPNESEVDQFLLESSLLELEPLTGQIYAVWENGRMRAVATIDGMRSLAERTGLYEGQGDPEWCDDEGNWTDYWPGHSSPVAARVRVYRKGAKRPTTGTANWDDFAPKGIVGAAALWDKASGGKPAHMLSTRGEALALRKAFPAQLSGLYTAEELGISPGAIGGVVEDPGTDPAAVAHDVPPSAGGEVIAPMPAAAPSAPAVPSPRPPQPSSPAPAEGVAPSVIVDEAGGQPSGPPARPAARRTLAEALASGEYKRLRGELTEALFGQMPDRLTDEQSTTLAAALIEAEEAGITPVELERNCRKALEIGEGETDARAQAIFEWIAERHHKAETGAGEPSTDLQRVPAAEPTPQAVGGGDPGPTPSLLDGDLGPEAGY